MDGVGLDLRQLERENERHAAAWPAHLRWLAGKLAEARSENDASVLIHLGVNNLLLVGRLAEAEIMRLQGCETGNQGG